MQQVARIEEIKSLLDNYEELIVRKDEKNNLEVISMDEYIDDDYELDDEIEEKLLKSEDDIRNGRTRDVVEVFKELKAKYGF